MTQPITATAGAVHYTATMTERRGFWTVTVRGVDTTIGKQVVKMQSPRGMHIISQGEAEAIARHMLTQILP